jgi:RNA polymerase sigma-70 factor, ECF subfamily
MCEELALGGVPRSVDNDGFDLSSGFAATRDVAQGRSLCSSPEAVFSSQRNSLVRALTLYCGDRGLAEDCVQEAFARLCLNWRRVSTYDDPAIWVRRVALNLAKDHRRLLVRRARLVVRLGDQQEPPPSRTEVDPQLWSAIRGLPSRQRTAVALYYVGDLKVAEVAMTMKISEGTVKRHLERARETLRKKLETSHEL